MRNSSVVILVEYYLLCQSLKRHKEMYHLKEKGYKCHVCGIKVMIKVLDKRLRSYYQRSFHCKFCESRFWNHSNLQRHMTIHMGEKWFKCKIYGVCFIQSNNCKYHMRTHTQEKPFDWNQSSKFFQKKWAPISHQKCSLERNHFFVKLVV